jgi:hypothetical protein
MSATNTNFKANYSLRNVKKCAMYFRSQQTIFNAAQGNVKCFVSAKEMESLSVVLDSHK